MSTVIAQYAYRYMVEAADTRSARAEHWEFHRAFETLEEAEEYAKKTAVFFPHVRIVDRETANPQP